MNKGEFISEVAAKTGQPKKLVSDIVDAAMDVTLDAMRKGKGVSIVGFGSLTVRQYAERRGRNPKTKEEIVIPASKRPAFKPGSEMKKVLAP